MREIRFRAKTYQGYWAYGYFYKTAKRTPYIMMGNGESLMIDEDTLGQFTGLKDKNGKEIYEEDIVNVHWFGQGFGNHYGVTETDNEAVRIVTWNDSLLCWCFVPILTKGTKESHENDPYLDASILQEPEEDLEVLGNIHDNPELLED